MFKKIMQRWERVSTGRLQYWRCLFGVGLFAVGAFSVGVVPVFMLPVAQAQTTRLNPARDPQQVPTARYGRGESVDLSLIVEEWRDRYPAISVYTCSCNADTCGDSAVWPFRDFTRYQPFVALGAFNATNNEDNGFNCFDMETGERP
ncbi:MAG: hypothetical protein AAFN12_12540 [Cyanobacteria bacterium J06560_2]